LEGHNLQNGREQFGGFWYEDGVRRQLRNSLVALGGYRNNRTPLLLEPLDVGYGLLITHHGSSIAAITGRKNHDWQSLIDQSVRTVLGFPGGIPLRMHVRYFFQLQGTVHGNGVVHCTA